MSNPGFRGDGQAQTAGQLIQPPNSLRDRIGPRLGRIDPNAIARAEAALRGLSSQFGQWLQDEVAKLESARSAVHAAGLSRETIDRVYAHAHDLKGLGATYDFPLITRLAGSLCRLLGEGDTRVSTPLMLIDAHVDAIAACLRDNIKDAENPAGRTLAEELEQLVAAYLLVEARA